MPKLEIKLEGDNCWPDLERLAAAGAILYSDDLEVAFLAGGMRSGAASVTLRINLPDGRVVLVETSHALFEGAARAFRARQQYLEELARAGGKA